MLRPPSNIRPYDAFFSGDPAFIQLEANASEEDKRAHAKKLEVARETGDWSALVIPGEQPTSFEMAPLTGTQYRRLIDAISSGKVGNAEFLQLAFRASVRSVRNLGQHDVVLEPHEYLGNIASRAIADTLDSLSVRIVAELGGEALRRASEVSPKSSRD